MNWTKRLSPSESVRSRTVLGIGPKPQVRKILTMHVLRTVLVFCAIAGVFSSCQKRSGEEKPFARVGRREISSAGFEAFRKMVGMYPHRMGEVFPGNRPHATLCVETEVLARKARRGSGGVKRSADWKWMERYFAAQLLLIEVLDRNLGATDDRIERYYQRNKDDYKRVIQVRASADTTDTATVDSVAYRSLAEVRHQLVQQLFLEEYPPDSAFFVSQKSEKDSAVDTSRVQQRWVSRVRGNVRDFFMKRYYQDRFGHAMPDSVKEWYGEGKVVTFEDGAVILKWLPEGDRSRYDVNDPEKMRYLAEWLMAWLLFSEKAEKTGYARTEVAKRVVSWAFKFELARSYVEEKIIPGLEKQLSVDTVMVVFEQWDSRGAPGLMPDSATVARKVLNSRTRKLHIGIEGAVYRFRRATGVEFLQSDFSDNKNEDPAALLAQADSLYGAGKSNEAEKGYEKLSADFLFREEGLKALTEMAKILTEKGRHREAIGKYREYLLLADDVERRCSVFFMIGFIYDEYLSKPEHAEVHYKWILKNTPDCELADDAEFMCLHLGEPMTDVDVLRAEARRQGRKIEEDETVAETGELEEAGPES